MNRIRLTVLFIILMMVLSLFIIPAQASTGSITVWFAPEQGTVISKEIINLIDSAQKSVLVSVYDINSPAIVNELVRKKLNGVDVKVVMDDREAQYEFSTVAPLKKNGILKTDTSSSNYMHNKFMVVDSEEVLTGSTNWTYNGFFENNNNSILVDSPELAKDYTVIFNRMWNGDFRDSKDIPYPEVQVGNTTIQCAFSPDGNVQSLILDEIDNAQKSIDFATFTFTSVPIEHALMNAVNKGVKVRGIYEARQKSRWCTYDELKKMGADVIYDENPATMHDKFFVIDGKTVITGSYNPTKHAEYGNNENVLIIKDRNIAGEYEKEFKKMFYSWGGKPSVVIELQPNSPYMTVNGERVEVDPGRNTAPVIIPKWNRTVVPVRSIVEALNGSIQWDGADKKVTVSLNDNTVVLWINKPLAYVNGSPVWIDASNHEVKPIIINNRTMLPLRFVTESLGCAVNWDANKKIITIMY
jgi:phosphatidylserine/phosphatidylglycerophosphate/cardiolipin synthase-like enzyme